MRLFQRNRFTLNLESTNVVADKIGFEKMLDNLLNNAMGMDEVTLKRVFRRYYQTKEAHSGEGIGLALVKAYCEEEKIRIEIVSKKARGTKVSLNLSQILLL